MWIVSPGALKRPARKGPLYRRRGVSAKTVNDYDFLFYNSSAKRDHLAASALSLGTPRPFSYNWLGLARA